MSKSQIPGERIRMLTNQFLDTATKTALRRAELVSKSVLSRLLNEYSWETAAC